VCTPTTYDLEEGRLFSDGRGVTLANALSEARFKFEQAYIVPVVHQWPLAPDGTHTPEQIAACNEEFKRELSCSQSNTVVLLGREALESVLGSGNNKGGLKKWRGYFLDLSECVQQSGLGQHVETVLPTYDPAYVQSTGFKTFAWFSKDILAAIRASRGQGAEIFGVPEQSDELPLERDQRDLRGLGIDIETNGFLGETEQIGYAWRSRK
jgi:uracil-DNA glycosylase family 4